MKPAVELIDPTARQIYSSRTGDRCRVKVANDLTERIPSTFFALLLFARPDSIFLSFCFGSPNSVVVEQ